MASLRTANRCKYIAILIYGPTKVNLSWVKRSMHLEDAFFFFVQRNEYLFVIETKSGVPVFWQQMSKNKLLLH